MVQLSGRQVPLGSNDLAQHTGIHNQSPPTSTASQGFVQIATSGGPEPGAIHPSGESGVPLARPAGCPETGLPGIVYTGELTTIGTPGVFKELHLLRPHKPLD
jgi:hypothetical protein